MNVTLFNKLAPRGYTVSSDGPNQIILVYNRLATTEHVAAFASRWNIELDRIPAPLRQFVTAYSLAATGGNHLYSKRDPGANRRIWKTFDNDLMSGAKEELYSDHGLFALTLPTARQLTGRKTLSRDQLISNIELQFALIAGLAAATLEKYSDPLKAAIALHTGYLEPFYNEFRVAYRGEFADKFIQAFNSYAEWHQTTHKENNDERKDANDTGAGSNTDTENG